MQVVFGAPVIGSDGQTIGHVDGLIVDSGTKRTRGILVVEGHFGGAKRLLETSAINRADQTGVYLSESGAAAEGEEKILDSEEIALGTRVPGETTFIPAAGVGGPIAADLPAEQGPYPDESSFFMMAPLDAPPVVIESNLQENDVVLGRGTHVLSHDHHKLGDATAFELGDMGTVTGVTVSEGFIFKHTAAFGLADIGEFGTDAVHLRLTQEQAEGR